MISVESRETREQTVRWIEDGQRQLTALLALINENDRLRERLEASESENERLRGLAYEIEQLRSRLETSEHQGEQLRIELGKAHAELERHQREREEVAERLTQFMNDVLARLRPHSSGVAEAA